MRVSDADANNAPMHSVLIVAISILTYGTGAVLGRRALRLRLNFDVHPLEALQILALVPMILLLRGPQFSLLYYLIVAASVCLMGTTMACAALLCAQPGKNTLEAQSAKPEMGISKRWGHAIVDYEIGLIREIWRLGRLATSEV